VWRRRAIAVAGDSASLYPSFIYGNTLNRFNYNIIHGRQSVARMNADARAAPTSERVA
jgi:hypothetical protein